MQRVKESIEKRARSQRVREEGNKLFKKGDIEGSLLKYLETVEMDESNELGLSNLSLIYYNRKEYLIALEYVEKSLE